MTSDPPRVGEGVCRAVESGEGAPRVTAAWSASAPHVSGERSLSRSGGGSIGTLLGIARHDRPRGDMATLVAAGIGLDTGVEGDFRGSLKPGHNKRQVTVMAAESWRDALAELGVAIAWELRRVNLLVEGLPLRAATGAAIIFAGGVVLDVTGECHPCGRMEEVAPGLKAVLLPDWRGGVTTKVRQGGRITVGESVRIER